MAGKRIKLPGDYEPKIKSAEEYNKVVSGSHLVGIQLVKSSFDVEADLYEDGNRKLNFDREFQGYAFDKEERSVAGWFKFEVTVKKGRKSVLKGSAIYMVIYGLEFDADEDAAITFCERIGVFAAFPYFRAHVAHLAWEANAPLPPLPTIATRGAPVRAVQPPGKV